MKLLTFKETVGGNDSPTQQAAATRPAVRSDAVASAVAGGLIFATAAIFSFFRRERTKRL